MSEKMVHLVYVTDVGYLMPTTVSMASAYAWCGDVARLVTHIVDIGIADDKWSEWVSRVRTRLPKAAQIVRHKLPENALEGFPKYRGNAATCARAYIPELLKDVDWCFYVDGDTMFFDDPLKVVEIYDEQYAFQAHRDRLEEKRCEDWHRAWFESHGLIWEIEQYGCAGVLLMNLRWFREHGVGKKLIDFMRKYQDSRWPDQDALYWVCRGHIKFLPDEWGMMDDHLWLSKGTVPACLHYVQRKPWNAVPQARGYWIDADICWIESAQMLTGYGVDRLLGRRNEWTVFSNSIGWLWKLAFRIASLNNEWRKSHDYRLMWIPPRWVLRHISSSRLANRLKEIGYGRR